jgi:hypothetical protein
MLHCGTLEGGRSMTAAGKRFAATGLQNKPNRWYDAGTEKWGDGVDIAGIHRPFVVAAAGPCRRWLCFALVPVWRRRTRREQPGR